MRDQWRAGDDSSTRPRDRAADRRVRSPSPPSRTDQLAGELRIRGRAAGETSILGPQGSGTTRDTAASPREAAAARERSRSSRREKIVERHKLPKDLNRRDKRGDRHPDRHESTRYRRRTRSRSPGGEYFDFRDIEGRRPASPSPHRRTDRSFRPSSRHRRRGHSPSRASRSDHYTSTSRIGDSYVPTASRLSRSPPPRERRYRDVSPVRRRSRLRHRQPHPQKSSVTPPLTSKHQTRLRSPRSGERYTSSYRPRPRSRHLSSHRKSSPLSPRAQNNPSHRERLLSPNHFSPRRGRSRDTRMQYSQHQSSPRPIPTFDASNQHRTAPLHGSHPHHGMKAHNPGNAHRHARPPHVDTRVPFSPSQQWTPTSSHHGSPHSASPYGQAREGWGGPSQQYQTSVNAHSPPYRQNNYPPQASPQAQYYTNGQQSPYANPQQATHGYPTQPSRGSHSSFRGNHYGGASERRFPGSIQSPTHGPTPSRGRGGHFQNLQWTANNGVRGRGDAQTSQGSLHTSPQHTSGPPNEEDENPFRPSKDLQVEDQSEKESKSASLKESSKISFAFKAKAPPPSSGKPPADLTQRTKETSRKDNLFDVSSKRRDAEDRFRSREDRYEHGLDRRYDRGRERSPERKIEKRVTKKKRPKRTLSPSLADSTSVYYRKPGNESVVGSGTYGKVFKAIHVYTKNLAALKKIRMEGEKDGFPVTAVREIKLLQSLKHDNVVSLQEVMVEHNDCFMVFEYLSHDLTGLLNHPTFKLDHAHKKHLGRQLFEGLNYLHKRGVLHRDIKAANILVSNEGQLKLADFGLARFYSKRGKPDYTNRVITIWYRPPELLLGETQYGPAVDIWSAACVMVEIFTRHAIFPGDGGEINQLDRIYNVLGTPTRSEWPGLVDMAWFELLRPTERRPNTFAQKYQGKVTPAAYELLTAMLLYDPSKRPSASDVLEHPYFTTEEPEPRQAIE